MELVRMLVMALLAAAGSVPQDPAQEPPKPAPVPAPPQAAPPKELVPGELPADAPEETKALWRQLCKAASGEVAQPKVTGFDIVFDVRGWQPGTQAETDFNDARFRYLEAGWVSHSLSKNGRRSLRGPQGDWLVDPQGAATRLQGVELAEDRKQLDQIALVSRTFVRLVDPRALRLRSLKQLPAPPFPLPESMLARAKELAWLDLQSPDFAIARSDGKASTREVRAWVGVDVATKLPQLAVVAEDDRGTLVHESALLVELSDYRALEGFKVPHKLRTFPADFAQSPWRFAERPNLSLWLKQGSLRPALVPADFEPPKPQK